MPTITGGGASSLTGAQIVDKSLSTADLSDAAIELLNPSVVSIIPRPNFPNAALLEKGVSSNTTLRLGMVNFPNRITATQVSFYANSAGAAGTLKVALFSEDGQTKLVDVTTASISGEALVTTTFAATLIPAGNYYLAVLPVSTASVNVICWSYDASAGNINNVMNNMTGKGKLNAILTVTASTMPATITPASLTADTDKTILAARFDA